MCFPSFDSVQCLLTPRPAFAHRDEHVVDLIHHASACRCSCVFARRCTGPVGIRHSLFQLTTMRCASWVDEKRTRNLKRLSKNTLYCPLLASNVMSSLTSLAYALDHRKFAGFGCKTHLSPSSNRSFTICCKCSFESGHHPAVVCPDNAADVMTFCRGARHRECPSFHFQPCSSVQQTCAWPHCATA